MKIVIVVPAFNEERKIAEVINGLKANGYKNIVIVNDASTDNTAQVVKSKNVEILSHAVNRGLGGALGTGFEYCKLVEADCLVTFDGDGQHDPKDVIKLVDAIQKNKADVVIGSRLINPKGMPFIRRVGNFGLNIVTYILIGVWTTDSQSGLRAFSKKAIDKIELKSNRMEVSSEFFMEIKRNNLKFKEVPIKAIYSNYSLGKGQTNLNAINIVLKLILKKLMR